MKVIDQTPFYKDTPELSLVDRAKAALQFGLGWFKEVEAQKAATATLGKTLDRSYTLLVNVTPPGLDARIPLILVGPTGVYVMFASPLIGTFRAKGDQWGTISGNAFRAINPNLLTRTERMARAIQVFLQRQGSTDLNNVESVLLFTDPSTHVDSMRPIVRVILSDGLERFAVSVAQARIVLTAEAAYDTVNRLLNPPAPPTPLPAEPEPEPEPVPAPAPAPEQPDQAPVPSFSMAGSEATPPFPQPPAPAVQPIRPPRRALSGKQIAFLVGMLVVWCLILAVFAFIVLRTNNPSVLIP